MLKKLTLATTISLLLSSNAFADGFTLSADGFTNNADGTVTDTKTGLIWQACSVGQTWDGYDCTGTAKTYSFSDALKITSSFANQNDWRVPNIRELQTIVEYGTSQPATNGEIFPHTPALIFWSKSFPATDSNFPWTINFGTGETLKQYFTYPSAIRLVRGATLSESKHSADFTKNADGTVTDGTTNLIWQRCSVGQTWTSASCSGDAGYFTGDEAAALQQDGWRLPTISELESIVDYTYSSPAINGAIFPKTPNKWTRSYSLSVDRPNDGTWMLNFDTGASVNYSTYSQERVVRLVKTGTGTLTLPAVVSGGVDLAPTIIGTPNPATVNGNITFTATLTNKGSATATDAKLSFALPKNTVSLVTKPDECIFTGLSVVCSVGNLVPNGSITKAVTVKMKVAGGLSFGVTSWANEKDVNQKNNIARATVAIRK